MRTRILSLFIGLFVIAATPLGAQFRSSIMRGQPVYCTSSAQVQEVGMHNATVMPVLYAQGTDGRLKTVTPVVYKAFDLSVPSEYTARNFGIGESAGKSPVARRGFIDGPETGRSDESPIGEPWILLILAFVFGVGIYFKTRKIKAL